MEDESLADLFRAVAGEVRARQRAELAGFDVTPSQARAVGMLLRHGTVRTGDLAGHLRIAPRSATEVVDDLEARGLVRRTADPGDRRATLVGLTPEGEHAAAAIRDARVRAAAAVFARLGPADRDELARLLRLLRADH